MRSAVLAARATPRWNLCHMCAIYKKPRPILVESLHALSLRGDLAVETDALVDAVHRDGDRPNAGGHLCRAAYPALKLLPQMRHLHGYIKSAAYAATAAPMP